MWSEIRDGMLAYDTCKSFSGKVALENLFIGFAFGVRMQSLWAGVIAFLVSFLLWSLPIIGTLMMAAFSVAYAVLAYSLLCLFCLPTAICFGIAAMIFLASMGAHIQTVGS